MLREISEAGQPALVTRRGRFVARISPATASSLEANALSVLLRIGDFREQYSGERTADGIVTSKQLLAALHEEGQRSEPGVSLAADSFYTMRELSHRTAQVIREINESDRPGYITRRGRLLAIISPLVAARLEEVALAAVLERTGAVYSKE